MTITEKIQGAVAALNAQAAEGTLINETMAEIMLTLHKSSAARTFEKDVTLHGPVHAIASAMTMGFALGRSVGQAEALEKLVS